MESNKIMKIPNDEKKYSFEIISDDGNNSINHYRFVLDNGKPIKLGDGTYGVVYKVEKDDDYFAAKLLYENDVEFKGLSNIDPDSIKNLLDDVLGDLKIEDEKATNIQKLILSQYQDIDGLILTFAESQNPEGITVVQHLKQKISSTPIERFKKESQATRIIKKSKRQKGLNPTDIGGTVQILGGTQKFKESSAYQNLKDFFVQSKISISNYALVMAEYEYSLKDLLEKGPSDKKQYGIESAVLNEVFTNNPPKELERFFPRKEDLEKEIGKFASKQNQPSSEHPQRQQLVNAIIEMVGYELLKVMDFRQRIQTAIPFLRYIATGIEQLHQVEESMDGPLFHLDIKPANIFVRKDRADGMICALGDLGYLPPSSKTPIVEISRVQKIDELPLGTLHYRSPEQKEYFDIANVEVEVNKNGESGKAKVCLKTRDPKFKGSFIEVGDIIHFSKDKLRVPYVITDIETDLVSNLTSIEINADQVGAEDGEQTQIVFQKKQGYRTDLFGLGAVTFDLITCGMSSERFYESIRRFEFNANGKDVGNVTSIMEKYRRVVDGQAQADEPSLIQIFEPFKHHLQPGYAPEDIVQLILKCMLYKAKDTFYESTEKKEKAISSALDYIKQLEKAYRVESEFKDKNPLIHLDIKRETSQGLGQVTTIINELQTNLSWELRLAQSSFYFEKIIALVLSQVSPESPFLYQMLPNAIRWIPASSKFEFSYPAYKEIKDYYEDMLQGGLSKMLRNPTHPFVPYQVAFLRRDMRVGNIEELGGVDKPHIKCNYSFLDSSPFNISKVSTNDWILFPQSKQLWQLVGHERNKNEITLKSVYPQPVKLNEMGSELEVVYFSDLDRCKYYLDLLGLYLHNIYFAYLPFLDSTRDKIDIRLLLLQKPNASQIKSPKSPAKSWWGPPISVNDELEYVIDCLAYYYLKLVWHDNPDSYYGSAKDKQNHKEIIKVVQNDAEAIRELIEKFFGLTKNDLRNELPRHDFIDRQKFQDGTITDLIQKPFNLQKVMLDMLA